MQYVKAICEYRTELHHLICPRNLSSEGSQMIELLNVSGCYLSCYSYKECCKSATYMEDFGQNFCTLCD